MSTPEERITTLEQAITGYRPILQDITYELTMVKGLAVDQIRALHELKQGIAEVKERLTQLETKFDQQADLLKQILARLPQK